MSYEKITYDIKENIGYIGFGANEKKSMTTLCRDSLVELRAAIDNASDLAKKGELKGVVFHSHKPGCFLAGVDVSLINTLNTELEAQQGAEAGQEAYNVIEDMKCPTIALVDGTCLGGGCELIMSCDTIVVSDNSKTQIGLPEVKLGILPGFGGTYRMPKRIGLPNALDLILSGKSVNAKKAKRLGLVDYVMPAERMLELAPEYLNKKKEDKKSFKDSVSDLATDNFISRKIIFQKAREKVLETTKGFYPAPLKILDLMEEGAGKSRKSYLAREAKSFGELSQTEQSQNLQHIFFLADNAKKVDYEKYNLKKVNKGAVLGAGTMGGGIAWLFANHGQAPLMKDLNKDALELGLKQSAKNFSGALKRKKMSRDDFERKQRSITPTLNYDGFKKVDLVIEAVVENMDIKKKVFSELEKQVSQDCIITSNTSSLSVNEMATAVENNARFAGLHFFNPVNRMPLVEIIRHKDVSEDTIMSLYKWCHQVKKTPIIVNDGPGFLVNRILMPFINESAYLLEEGVSIEDLDKAVLNFGMPMGPCRLMDEIGIDVLVKVGKIMEDGLGARAKANEISHKVTEAGLLGKKSGKGFYKYGERGKPDGINEEILRFLPSVKKSMDETTIQMRVFLPMINEAATILEEGIVDSASTVDLGLIFGIGFPPFRGGLLKYADKEGLDRILKAIESFASSVDSERYAPSSFLKKLTEEKKKFYDL